VTKDYLGDETDDDDIIELTEEVVSWPDDDFDGSLTKEEALNLLNEQAAILITVATTRDAKVADYNVKYKRGRRRLNSAFRSMGITQAFPYDDLFVWQGRWSAGGFPTYHSRRRHIEDLAQPARDALVGVQLSDPGSTGQANWANVDAEIEAVTARLRTATSREDFKDVGRRCRDILIDAAALLADPSMVPPGSDPPKLADAKQWLEIVLDSQTKSPTRFRALIRPTWQLAQRVTHAGDRVETYAAAQATVLIVRTLQQLA
jgi:hypothetical protein